MAIRLGAEDKKKRLIAGVLVSVALGFIAKTVWYLAGGPPSALPPVTPQITMTQGTTTAATSNGNAGGTAGGNAGEPGRPAQHLESATALDPTLHPERMAMAENTKYTGTSRNIFSKDSLPPAQVAAIEAPVASARTTGPAAPAGPPPPPPIDLKFYGFAKRQNGQQLVFLMHGEDIFVAGAGDIVDGRYKVIRVNENSVVIEDLAYTNQQTLQLQIS